MPKRSRTGKPDVNQMAANLIDAVAGDLPAGEQQELGKNPVAVALANWADLKTEKLVRQRSPHGGAKRLRPMLLKNVGRTRRQSGERHILVCDAINAWAVIGDRFNTENLHYS